MTCPTKRELKRQLERLQRQQSASTATDVSVAWREAAPNARPEGLCYDADAATLTYDVWAAQRECLDALDSGDHDIVAFLAGYGSGKTLTGARWTIANALANPGSHFLAMGQSFSEARSSTFETLFAQLPGDRTTVRTASFNGPEQSPIVADYNRSEHRLTLTNDAVITLGSADRWSRFAGAEFGGIWLDEPSHYGSDLHDLLEMLGSRLRGVPGPKVQCWTLTGNGYNDAWEILAQRQDTTGDPIGLAIELIRASTLDNPYLDPGDIERFERQYGDTARETQALHGGFAAAQGLVYSRFRRDRHVIPHAEARARVSDEWRIYGYDAGWKDPRVLLELGKTGYDQLVVLDAFHESGSHIADAVDWLTDHDKPTGTIYCEHEPEHVDRFRRAGYRATPATKDLDAGIAEVRKRLRPDGAEPVADTSGQRLVWDGGEPAGRVGLLVADRCEHLVREFLGYKEAHVGTTAAVDHCLDALRYACMGVTGDGGHRTVASTW